MEYLASPLEKTKQNKTGSQPWVKRESRGLLKLPLLIVLLLQVIGGGGRRRVRVARQRRHGDDVRRSAQASGGVLLHVVGGDDCQRGAPFLVLVGLDVLGEVVAAHEALGALGTLEALFSWKTGEDHTKDA